MPRGLSISLISSASIGLKKSPYLVSQDGNHYDDADCGGCGNDISDDDDNDDDVDDDDDDGGNDDSDKMIMVTMMMTTMMTMMIKLIITILGIPLLGHAVAPVANCCQAEYGSQVKQDMTLKEFCDYWNKKSGGRSP